MTGINEITRLKVVIEQKDAALAEANRRADSYRESLYEVLAENGALLVENERLKEKVDAYSRANGSLIDERAALREEIERLKAALQMSVDGHTRTDADFVRVAQENKRLCEKIERLKAESDVHCEEAGRGMRYVIALKEENERLRRQLAEVRSIVG